MLSGTADLCEAGKQGQNVGPSRLSPLWGDIVRHIVGRHHGAHTLWQARDYFYLYFFRPRTPASQCGTGTGARHRLLIGIMPRKGGPGQKQR